MIADQKPADQQHPIAGPDPLARKMRCRERQRHAGMAPRLGMEHQCEQAGNLRILALKTADHPSEPDRFMRQIVATEFGPGAAGVALVEDQVQDVQNGAQALGPLVGSRLLEGNAGVLDGLLGPADALGHGRLGHEKRPGDLGRRQAADRTQGQGNR